MDEKRRMIEFLKENHACKEGLEFAIRECNSLEDCWNKAKPEWLVWLATIKGVLTDRELHEFMLASAKSARHLIKDQISLAALTVDAYAYATATATAAAHAAHAAGADAAYTAERHKQADWLRNNTKPNL